jgi:hypothetical protein
MCSRRFSLSREAAVLSSVGMGDAVEARSMGGPAAPGHVDVRAELPHGRAELVRAKAPRAVVVEDLRGVVRPSGSGEGVSEPGRTSPCWVTSLHSLMWNRRETAPPTSHSLTRTSPGRGS